MENKKTQIELVRELMTHKGHITPAYLSSEDCRVNGRLMAVDSIRKHCSTLRKMGEFGSVSKRGIVTYWPVRIFDVKTWARAEIKKEKKQFNLFGFKL